MNDKLKPCPFCGGNALYQAKYAGVSAPNVICAQCKSGTDTQDTEEEAVAAWNTRPGPKVKELVWTPSTAQSPFGLYRLEYGEESPYRFMARATLDEVPVSEWFLESDDEDYAWKAPAAAQDDYERRVLACLEGAGE